MPTPATRVGWLYNGISSCGARNADGRQVLTGRGGGTGRRKEAIARVRIAAGTGEWKINDRTLDGYFPNKVHQQLVNEPFVALGAENRFDVIARITGGEAFFPHELGEIVSICERIARDIRNQYTIGYVPSNVEKPGAYRTIRVAATGTPGSKLVVRARSGYIAAGEPNPAKHEAAK